LGANLRPGDFVLKEYGSCDLVRNDLYDIQLAVDRVGNNLGDKRSIDVDKTSRLHRRLWAEKRLQNVRQGYRRAFPITSKQRIERIWIPPHVPEQPGVTRRSSTDTRTVCELSLESQLTKTCAWLDDPLSERLLLYRRAKCTVTGYRRCPTHHSSLTDQHFLGSEDRLWHRKLRPQHVVLSARVD
jgi:hypothetical protein